MTAKTVSKEAQIELLKKYNITNYVVDGNKIIINGNLYDKCVGCVHEYETCAHNPEDCE